MNGYEVERELGKIARAYWRAYKITGKHADGAKVAAREMEGKFEVTYGKVARAIITSRPPGEEAPSIEWLLHALAHYTFENMKVDG